MVDATRAAWVAGCNPGGEVAGVPFPADRPPSKRWLNRLLSKREALEVGGHAK